MTPHSLLDRMRQTRLWQKLRDWRYLRRQRARRQLFRPFVPAGGLVFDVGANVGHYTLLFHSLGARVVAIEPQHELAAGLRWRFAGARGIEIVQTALGAAPSTARLHKSPALSEIASLRDDIAERSRFASQAGFSDSETVPVATLDSLIAQFGRPDFCKIDVEGFEREVLAGLNCALPSLSLEFNREFWRETVDCMTRLGQLGAYRFNYALAESTRLNGSGWNDAAQTIAELSADPDPLQWGDLYARLAGGAPGPSFPT